MRVAVIGSGPSGLHFTKTALEMGHKVILMDGGSTVTSPSHPDANFLSLKTLVEDSVTHFLGKDYQSIELPSQHDDESGVYGFPGSKSLVFASAKERGIVSNGFSPLLSLAAGGLAECWTAGAYPFTDSDLTDFPFEAAEILPYYSKVAERIGVGGVADDLADAFPPHENLLTPIELNESSARLLDRYSVNRARIREVDPGARFGRSRQAALSVDLQSRKGCSRCGRCLWGCPLGALYTPSLTLSEMRHDTNLDYRPGAIVSHLSLSARDTIDCAHISTTSGEKTINADVFVLAAGTIQTAQILLRSYWARDRDAPRLEGLMDNRQILLPFLNLAMLGQPYRPDSYQYHQLALGLEDPTDPFEYVHGQITTLTTATAHPILKQLPMGMRPARSVFLALRSALGLINLNFSDVRRSENFIQLEPDILGSDDIPSISISYVPPGEEPRKLKKAIARARRIMQLLRAPLLPGMTQIRPMGASVHYAGTIPMSSDRRPLTVMPNGRSHDFDNLIVADGSVFPSLPAKNLTFTLMANATRTARENL